MGPQIAPRGLPDPPKSPKRAPRCPKRAPRGPQYPPPKKSPIAPRRPTVLQDSLQDGSTLSSPSSPCPLCFTICASPFHFPSALMGRASTVPPRPFQRTPRTSPHRELHRRTQREGRHCAAAHISVRMRAHANFGTPSRGSWQHKELHAGCIFRGPASRKKTAQEGTT